MKEFEYTFRVSNTVRSFLPPSIKVFSFFFFFLVLTIFRVIRSQERIQ